MPSRILKREFSGVVDNRAVLEQSNFVRPFDVGDWNKIRVCCRMTCTDGGAGIFPVPNHFAIGLCSGSTGIFNDASTQQFIGAISYIGTGAFKVNVTRSAAPRYGMTYRIFPASKIGTTILGVSGATTVANPYADVRCFLADDATGPWRSCLFVDITRPGGATTPTSGDYQIALFGRDNLAPTVDVSFSVFASKSLDALPILTQHTYRSLPLDFSAPAATVNIAGDEITYGALDHVCLACDDSRYTVEISDVGIVKFS